MGVELVKKEESNYKKRNKKASEKKTRQKWPLSDLDSEVGEVGDFRFLKSQISYLSYRFVATRQELTFQVLGAEQQQQQQQQAPATAQICLSSSSAVPLFVSSLLVAMDSTGRFAQLTLPAQKYFRSS